MTTWVIQNNFIDQTQADIVAKSVLADGGKVAGAKVIPFCDTIKFWDNEAPQGPLVVPYGATKLTKMARKYDWKGVFFNDNFDTAVWNANRSDMLNQDGKIMKVSETAEFLKGYPDDLPMFIRPCLDLKAFNGTLTRVSEIKNWMKSTESGNFSFNADTLVSIAEAKHIQAEWRWFVVDGKVIDGSIYRLRGQRLTIHERDQKVIDEAQGFADVWLPDSTCVMDLALTEDGMKCIEFNCFNSSGYYNHDIEKIVKAVNSYMRKTYA
jgi:hypothetical protein